MPPIGLRFNTFFQVVSKNRNNFNAANLANPGTFIPRTDFQPGLFSIFMAGNFGSDIAFWVDDDISVGGANSNGGLGDGCSIRLGILCAPAGVLPLQLLQL